MDSELAFFNSSCWFIGSVVAFLVPGSLVSSFNSHWLLLPFFFFKLVEQKTPPVPPPYFFCAFNI